jgi:hypothetical protein
MSRQSQTRFSLIVVSLALGMPHVGCTSSSHSTPRRDADVDSSADAGTDTGTTVDANLGGTGGAIGTGGSVGTGGRMGTGGTPGTGGFVGTGGALETGGTPGTGGFVGTGGALETGGTPGTGGFVGTGGALGTGGAVGTGGFVGTGGTSGTGGAVGTGGFVGTGGTSGTGGAVGTGGTRETGGVTGAGGIAGTGGTGGAGGSTGGEYGFSYRVPTTHTVSCSLGYSRNALEQDWLCTFHQAGVSGYIYVQSTPTDLACIAGAINPVYTTGLKQLSIDGNVSELSNAQYNAGGIHGNDYLTVDYQGKTHKYYHSSFTLGLYKCQPMDCIVVYAAGSSTTVETDGCTSARTLPEVCVAIKADGSHAALTPDPFAKCPDDPNP